MKKNISLIKNWRNGFIWHDLFKRKSKHSLIHETLKTSFIFQNLNSNELHYLEKIIHIRDYVDGELIFKQNERGSGLYLIVSGQVSIRLEDKSDPIAILQPGTFFGEQAIIENDSIRTSSAYAVEPTRLLALLKPDLVDIVNRNPSLGVKILLQISLVLSRRLRETTDKITKLSSELIDIYTKQEPTLVKRNAA